jgi:hypothetical protein
MNGCPPKPDARSLVEDYETLRHAVVDLGGGAGSIQGRALLMFRGMAAWIQALAQRTERTSAPLHTQAPVRLPAGMQENLVHIVATMALTAALEGRQ